MNDPQELLAAYATKGSEAAFTELVQRHLNFVYSAALRLTNGDTHLSEDITQIVFADLARTARTLSRKVMLGGWLHRHACFVAANAMRAQRRRHSYETKAAEMNAPQDHSDANLASVAPDLDEAINQLSDDDRRAIILRFFEQRDFDSVGQGLGTSGEAARKRVTRALEKLHSHLTCRGATLSAAGLVAALGSIIAPAPSGMAAEIAATAVAGAVASGAGSTGLTLTTLAKLKPALLAVAFVAAVGTPLVIKHQSEMTLREENQALRNEVQQMAAVQAEKNALSNQLSQVRRLPVLPGPTVSPDEHRELLRLRGQVGVLRDQLAKASQTRTESAPLAGSAEPADITLIFPSIPMMRLLDAYQRWSGKTVAIAPDVQASHTIWLSTPPNHLFTKTEATLWVEEALKDQCHVVIARRDDGSLLVQPEANP